MNKLEQPKWPEWADILIFAVGIVIVALGATVIYALSVLGKIGFSTAVWALVILGAVGMILVTVGVLARSRRRELRRRAQEEQLVTKVRLPRLYPRDIREDTNQSNDWRK